MIKHICKWHHGVSLYAVNHQTENTTANSCSSPTKIHKSFLKVFVDSTCQFEILLEILDSLPNHVEETRSFELFELMLLEKYWKASIGCGKHRDIRFPERFRLGSFLQKIQTEIGMFRR